MPIRYGVGLGWPRRISQACAYCGTVREYRLSEIRTYCTHACYAASRVGKYLAPRTTFVCVVCGATVTRLASGQTRYCSVVCANEARRQARPLAARFWEKVERGAPDACWPWRANMGTDGYGKFWRDGKSHHASRIAWELTFGPIPEATNNVLHRCDNPRCCNPAHLFVGTRRDNRQDMLRKGRGLAGDRHPFRTNPEAILRGESHPMAKLTADDIRAIRAAGERRAPATALASIYGVTAGTIRAIWRHAIWRRLP